jgi:hypothetical protein
VYRVSVQLCAVLQAVAPFKEHHSIQRPSIQNKPGSHGGERSSIDRFNPAIWGFVGFWYVLLPHGQDRASGRRVCRRGGCAGSPMASPVADPEQVLLLMLPLRGMDKYAYVLPRVVAVRMGARGGRRRGGCWRVQVARVPRARSTSAAPRPNISMLGAKPPLLALSAAVQIAMPEHWSTACALVQNSASGHLQVGSRHQSDRHGFFTRGTTPKPARRPHVLVPAQPAACLRETESTLPLPLPPAVVARGTTIASATTARFALDEPPRSIVDM